MLTSQFLRRVGASLRQAHTCETTFCHKDMRSWFFFWIKPISHHPKYHVNLGFTLCDTSSPFTRALVIIYLQNMSGMGYICLDTQKCEISFSFCNLFSGLLWCATHPDLMLIQQQNCVFSSMFVERYSEFGGKFVFNYLSPKTPNAQLNRNNR